MSEQVLPIVLFVRHVIDAREGSHDVEHLKERVEYIRIGIGVPYQRITVFASPLPLPWRTAAALAQTYNVRVTNRDDSLHIDACPERYAQLMAQIEDLKAPSAEERLVIAVTHAPFFHDGSREAGLEPSFFDHATHHKVGWLEPDSVRQVSSGWKHGFPNGGIVVADFNEKKVLGYHPPK